MARARSIEKEQKWRAHVDAMAASGLSLRAFAAREGLNPHTLWTWKVRLRERDSAPEPAPTFVAVNVSEPARPEAPIEIVLRDGVALRVSGDFDEATLARVVRALQGAR